MQENGTPGGLALYVYGEFCVESRIKLFEDKEIWSNPEAEQYSSSASGARITVALEHFWGKFAPIDTGGTNSSKASYSLPGNLCYLRI